VRVGGGADCEEYDEKEGLEVEEGRLTGGLADVFSEGLGRRNLP
jgi:hypothetical protein